MAVTWWQSWTILVLIADYFRVWHHFAYLNQAQCSLAKLNLPSTQYGSSFGNEKSLIFEKCENAIWCTGLSPISGHRWCKKMCPLIRGVRFFESWAILVLFSKIYYFYTYICHSQGKWKTSGSLWTKKRKKEMMLNCCNLKCFKTKYQLVKSTLQTLF